MDSKSSTWEGKSHFCEKPLLKSKPSRFGNIWSRGSVLDNRWSGEARVGVAVRASGPEPKSANPQALMARKRQHFEHIDGTGAGTTVRSLEKTGIYSERCLSYLPGPSRFDKVNYPPPRCLRQQTPNTISHVLLSLPHFGRQYHLCANRTRLPEFNEKPVEVQPLPTDRFSNSPSDVGIGIDESEGVRDPNRNLFEISMFGCNSSECHDDPCDRERSRPKNRIPEFFRFREVDGSRVGATWRQSKSWAQRRTKMNVHGG